MAQKELNTLALPGWKENAITKLSEGNIKPVVDLVPFVRPQNRLQRWYYAGSGADPSPLIFSPEAAEHTFVDREYFDPSILSKFRGGNYLIGALKGFGAQVEALETNGNKTSLVVNNTTRVELIGQSLDQEVAPSPLDVIYYGDYEDITPPPGPDALQKLKKGGLLLAFSRGKEVEMYDRNVTEFGYTQAFRVVNSRWRGSNGSWEIFRKLRDLTDDELDYVFMSSSSSEFSGLIPEFLNEWRDRNLTDNSSKLSVAEDLPTDDELKQIYRQFGVREDVIDHLIQTRFDDAEILEHHQRFLHSDLWLEYRLRNLRSAMYRFRQRVVRLSDPNNPLASQVEQELFSYLSNPELEGANSAIQRTYQEVLDEIN